MKGRALALCLVLALAAVVPVLGQGLPTGTLTGRVTANDGTALPGVVVNVSSSSLQGTRNAVTSAAGDYNLPLLPPGEYQVQFDLEGFVSLERTVKISAAQNLKLDAEMATAAVAEEIVVVGVGETISQTAQAATTYSKQFVDSLPIERNLRETVLLTPGVAATGPGGARARAITIAGSQSYENLFLVNGVVVNENIRGQAFNLFIEDAIEETTTTVSGISAEYGRFGGGVVNVLTKSGGNEFHGSLRAAVTNQSWEGQTPVSVDQTDKNNYRYEGTLGGWLMKDHVWFFGAGRDFEDLETAQTTFTNIPFPEGEEEKRYEGKLTVSPSSGHRLVGSYIKVERDEAGNRFGNVLDTRSVVTRSLPQELLALNYTGVLTENFFVEGQYSEREFTFENSGSLFTDRINGTLLVDNPTGRRWWSPTFCGVCRPEERDNENFLVKGSYFLSTKSAGSHDIAVGYDTFTDIRAADNHQSGSDYRILLTNTIIRGTDLFPQLISGTNTTRIQYNPIDIPSQGTDFVTNSFFVNDRWRLNDKWSFNVGVRFDENDGRDAEGKPVAKDSRISPRLSFAFDPQADGEWIFRGSYAEYVTALANNQGDSTSRAGNPAAFQWFYRGPSINPDPNAPNLLTADQALAAIFAWFDSEGGNNNISNLAAVNIPGATTVIDGSLDSPYTTEYALGFSKRLGARGVVRADYVRREGHDFYATLTTLATGQVTTPTGGQANRSLVVNDDSLTKRTYDGLHTQFQYRLDKWNFGGNYTLSYTEGNFDGETTANGPIRSGNLQFPEYFDASWSNPEGYLATDRRHGVRAWVLYDVFNAGHHNLSVGLLQNYFSGTPYGAVGGVDTRANAGAPPGLVVNPGYAIPPTAVAYYFTDRDAFRLDDITSTDLSVNYSFNWAAFGKDIEVFLQPEVLNLFDESGVINVNTTVLTATNTAGLQRFNPFTTEPVEGVHWRRGTQFGQPVADLDYQQPRVFRFSVGFRF